jgi:hypothetical protein
MLKANGIDASFTVISNVFTAVSYTLDLVRDLRVWNF